MPNGYQTRAVLADARTSDVGKNRTHVVEWGTFPLCRVKMANLADEFATDPNAPATCPTCARRDPRFKTGT